MNTALVSSRGHGRSCSFLDRSGHYSKSVEGTAASADPKMALAQKTHISSLSQSLPLSSPAVRLALPPSLDPCMMHEAITAFTGKSSFLPIKGMGRRDKAEMPHAPFTRVVSGMHSFRPRHPASLPWNAFPPSFLHSLLSLESSIEKF